MFSAFGNVVTAAVTPFDAAGEIDEARFRELLRHLAANGSDSVVIAGTTGESPTLSDDEKLRLFAVAVDELGGSVPVIAGTGGNDTRHSVELTRRACETGVDGVLVVVPYYNKPPRRGLLRHFQMVAEASSVPLVMYNIPSRVVINMEPDLIAELAQVDNIVALKQANPDLEQTRAVAELAPDLAIYAGNDDLLVELLQFGALGGICVASHLVGTQMGEIVRRYRDGDEAGARELDAQLAPLYSALNVTSNPIPLKAALPMIGIDCGGVRMPLVEASALERETVRAGMDKAGVLSGARA